MNYELINSREDTGLGFTIMNKNKIDSTRDSAFISDRKTLKNGIAYLFKIKSEDSDMNYARFLHFHSNIGPDFDLNKYIDNPEEFKHKAAEYVEDTLYRSDVLIEKCIARNSRNKNFSFNENSDIAFDPIISCSAETTRLLIDRFDGDVNEAGKYLTELALDEIIPNIIGEKRDDYNVIAAAQIDNGLLHLHTVIFRVKPNLRTLDFNPSKMVEKMNFSRVKTTLNHLDTFHLREKDIVRACRYLDEGKLNEFLEDEEVLNYLGYENSFPKSLQDETYKVLSEIFEENKRDKHKLRESFDSAGYKFTFKPNGRKKDLQMLWLPDGSKQPIENFKNKDLQKLARKIIELRSLDEEYEQINPDLSAFLRLEEVEDFVQTSKAKTVEELNQELADIGMTLTFNIDKNDVIKGVSFYDKKHKIEIKSSISDTTNLSYFQKRFNLSDELMFIRANNELYKNKKNNLKVKTLSKYKKHQFIPRPKSNFKKFRFSEFEDEDAFFNHFKSINAGHSLIKTIQEESKYYNAKIYFQFEVVSDSKISVASYNGKTNASAIKAALQYAIAAGATEIELEGGSEQDKRESYKIATLMGLKVKGYKPDLNLQKEINEKIAEKTADIESKFLPQLERFIAEKKQAEEAGEEFTKKLFVKSYNELQLEVDSTAYLINTLHCVASGLSTNELMNVSEERMIDELQKVKMLAAKAYPDDPRIKAMIQYLESLQASGTSSISPENTNKPTPNQKPIIRPKLDI